MQCIIWLLNVYKKGRFKHCCDVGLCLWCLDYKEQSWYDKWTELQFVLKRNFKVKNLGDLQYFLGIGIVRTDEGIVLNQQNMP